MKDSGVTGISAIVFGNFGRRGRTESSGQIIRTREVSSAIRANPQVSSCSELNYAKRRIATFLKLLTSLHRPRHFFILPGHQMIFVIGFTLRMLRFCPWVKARFHLVAIGGWISRCFAISWQRWLVGGFDSVSVQIPSIAADPKKHERTYWLPNFRTPPPGSLFPKKSSPSVRLVHISRLIPAKGVFDSIRTAEVLDSLGIEVSLNIYGPNKFTAEDDRIEFYRKTSSRNSLAKWRGDLPPNQVIETMAEHDYVLFPSTFPDEGFPGTIVEAMLAKTPVIARDWAYISELAALYHFGFVVQGDFPAAAARVIVANREKVWRPQRDLLNAVGPPVVQAWLAELLADENSAWGSSL